MKYLLLLCLTVYSYCLSRFGRCNTKLKSNLSTLNLNNLMGIWYEIARNADFPNERGECSRISYQPKPNGLEVIASEVRNNTWVRAVGEAVPTKDVFRLKVTYDLNHPQYKENMMILDTDYTTYAVIYSCDNHGLNRHEYVWILSRTPLLDQSKIDSLVIMIKSKLKIDKSHLHFTYQGPSVCNI
jgi:lipocalin